MIFTRKTRDDQAAQVYVLFPRFPAKLNTEFVCYYWESNPKNKGLEGPSVAWSKARVIVLQAGTEKLNQWVTEKRNVYEDYKRLFGKEPPKAGGVAFYINSQHTQSSAESYSEGNILFQEMREKDSSPSLRKATSNDFFLTKNSNIFG